MANIEVKDFTTSRRVYLVSDIDKHALKDLQNDIQRILEDDQKIINNNVKNLQVLGQEYVDVYLNNIKYQPIILSMSSPGGNAYYGLGIYDYIKSINALKRQEIIIECNGVMASMASIIILAAEKRKCTKNTTFMVHSIASLQLGKIEDLREDLAETERLAEIIKNIYVENTRLTKEKLEEIDKLKTDWWFNAEKAKELGFVKEVI